MSTASWAIIGCGYTGAALARRLVAGGTSVVLARRNPAALAELARELGPLASARSVDLSDEKTLGDLFERDVIAFLAPSGQVPKGSARRVIYVSSTSVYAPAAGAIVDETWPTTPSSPAGEARLATENALRHDLGARLVILRAAAIYGPGRGIVARLRAGTMRLVDGGRTVTSRVHVDDLAAAIALAGFASAPHPVYNVADREPAATAEVAATAAAALGVPLPPSINSAEVSADLAAMATGDRRIDASLLERHLGWTPRYPTWREGLASELDAPAPREA